MYKSDDFGLVLYHYIFLKISGLILKKATKTNETSFDLLRAKKKLYDNNGHNTKLCVSRKKDGDKKLRSGLTGKHFHFDGWICATVQFIFFLSGCVFSSSSSSSLDKIFSY